MPGTIGKYPLPLKLLIFGRASVAITSVFTPRVFARRFRIQTAGTPAVVLGRMFGVRNAALALGLLGTRFIRRAKGFPQIKCRHRSRRHRFVDHGRPPARDSAIDRVPRNNRDAYSSRIRRRNTGDDA